MGEARTRPAPRARTAAAERTVRWNERVDATTDTRGVSDAGG